MKHSDEFEFVASDENSYNVKVFLDEGLVESFSVYDEMGEEIDSDHLMFDEISGEVYNREYKVENHSNSFDFYDQQLDHFDKSEFSLKDV